MLRLLLLGVWSRSKGTLKRRELGDSFKWLFYGDDDTFYVVDPALKLLQGLDHDMPYFLTGATCMAADLCLRFSSAAIPLSSDACNLSYIMPLTLANMQNRCPCDSLLLRPIDHACRWCKILRNQRQQFLKNPDTHSWLADHMWWTEKWTEDDGSMQERVKHPHRAAPACVPCHYKKNVSGLAFPFPQGCPCTPASLCNADTKGQHP